MTPEQGSGRTCIFCALPLGPGGQERAKEHVVPEWMQEYFQISGDELYQAVAGSGGIELGSERRQVMDSFQEGRVCKPCNEGWMSNLEGQFKPLFCDDAEGRIPIHSRTAAEIEIAAAPAANRP